MILNIPAQSLYYFQGRKPCIVLYKHKNSLGHDTFRIKLVDTHEILEVSPRDLHLWQIQE